MSHLGRPNGQNNPKLSLLPVAIRLEKIIEKKVTLLSGAVGDESVETACANPETGSIFVLENIRYYPEEEGKGVDAEGK